MKKKSVLTIAKSQLKELEQKRNQKTNKINLRDFGLLTFFNEEMQKLVNLMNDFKNEIDNIQVFYDKFKDVKDVCIPHVYSYFTEANPNAIVMDYIEGVRLENVEAEDRDKYSKILSRFNIKSVFYDSLYHADLHSGNIIFMKEPCDTKTSTNTDYMIKIGVIDYGIIGKLTREEQNLFFTFFKILVSGNYEKLAKYIIQHLSEPLEKGEKREKREKHDKLNEKLIKDIYDVCYHTLNIKQIFFGGEEIYEVNKILKTQNLTFSKFFCRIELAIAISENVCNSLCKDKTYIEQLMSAFKDLFSGSYDSIFDDNDNEDEEYSN